MTKVEELGEYFEVLFLFSMFFAWKKSILFRFVFMFVFIGGTKIQFCVYQYNYKW